MASPLNAPSAKFVNGNSNIRKELLDITNRIHAAQNIKQILVDLKSGILNIFNANSITIYVVDKLRNEIYSMFLAGTQLKEIRLPINNKS
ncbi:MAG: pilus assembly protein, partial [Smithella sp.]